MLCRCSHCEWSCRVEQPCGVLQRVAGFEGKPDDAGRVPEFEAFLIGLIIVYKDLPDEVRDTAFADGGDGVFGLYRAEAFGDAFGGFDEEVAVEAAILLFEGGDAMIERDLEVE